MISRSEIVDWKDMLLFCVPLDDAANRKVTNGQKEYEDGDRVSDEKMRKRRRAVIGDGGDKGRHQKGVQSRVTASSKR